MIRYDHFYKEHGIRLIRDFLEPVVWKSDIIVYPVNTVLILGNDSLVVTPPTTEYPYLHNLHKPRVYVMSKYPTEPTFGHVKLKHDNTKKLIKDFKKSEPSFHYAIPGTKLTIPARSELLISLGGVNNAYRYTPHPLNIYYVWANHMTALAEYATIKRSGLDRHKFIILNLPYVIPKREYISKYIGEPSRATLNHFGTGSDFNILELFRFVSKDHKELSILAKTIPENEFKYVDIVLNINAKMVILNLATLASITDAHELTTKLKKYPFNTAMKILYVFLNRVIEASPIIHRVSDVNIETYNMSEVDVEVDNVADIDDIIKSDVDENKKEPVQETISEDVDTAVANIDTSSAEEDVITDEDIDKATDLHDTTHLKATITAFKDNKFITKAAHDKLILTLDEQESKPSPYMDGTTLKDTITQSMEDVLIDTKEQTITNTSSTLSDKPHRDVLKDVDKKYIEKSLRKDILSTMYSIQRAGVIITDHAIKRETSVLGDVEEHTMSLTTPSGDKSTIKLKLPVVDKSGVMSLNGNRYVMRRQRADIPVKKISNTIASINSYYGKLFVSKATYKKDDIGFWFHKQLLKLYTETNNIKDIATLEVVTEDTIVPRDYGSIARYVKSFKYKTVFFNFDYKDRKKVFNLPNLDSYEKNGSVVVGVTNGNPIVMDMDNILYIIEGKKYTELGSITDYLNIDTSKAPTEYCNAKIYKEQIPVGIILSYYIGFDRLLKHLDVSYEVIETGKRYKLLDNQYRIIFRDKTYIITKDFAINDLIIYGIATYNKYLKLVTVNTANSKSNFTAIFTAMGLPVLYVNEIKLMETMYLDPITIQVLEMYKFPTTFKGVLIKAVDMLRDDNYIHPNSIEGSIIKGYERLSGMMYIELVKAMRTNINKSHFGKSKITISPYAVINKVGDDSTVVLEDDLNPLALLKQHEDVTYLGSHGRKEETMSAKTRVMHSSEIGITSEAVKDSGAVGISSYLSAEPNIESTRGTTGKLKASDKWASRLSTSAMLAPFGTKDDPKRLNFINIMNGHVIPMNEMRGPYVRTGYETTVAVRSSSKFVISAKEEGVVTSVSNNNISVKYKTLGNVKYKLAEWTSKEESHVSYKHKQIPNLTKGSKFIKDDTLAYDPSFYEPDIFNPYRVIFKMGTYITVALMEITEDYEDSGVISESLAKRMGTNIVKIKSIVTNSTDNIYKPLLPGDKVEPNTPYLSIADASLSMVSELDARALEVLKDLKMLTPKAKYRGVINKVRVFYNCEFKDLTPSLKKLAKISDDALLEETGHTGMVDASYSINGKPLLEDTVEIKYYTSVNVGMGTGDKAVLGNQLKFTIGEVFPEPPVAEDGTEIECIFSTRAISARIVNSPDLIGSSAMVLEKITDKVVSDYFK